jgi:hypothetical protein
MTRARRASVLAIAFFLLFTAQLTLAQPSAQAPSQHDAWEATVGHQLAAHLASSDVDRQNRALHLLNALSVRDAQALNLTPTAAPLLDVYATADDADRRMMAVEALSRLDNPKADARLVKLGTSEPDADVRRAILHSVEDTETMTPTEAEAYNELQSQQLQAPVGTTTAQR